MVFPLEKYLCLVSSLVTCYIVLPCIVSPLSADSTDVIDGPRHPSDFKCHHEILVSFAAILSTMKWREISIIYETTDSAIVTGITRYLEANHSYILETLINVDLLSLETLFGFLIRKYREVGDRSSVPVIFIARTRKMLHVLKMVDSLDLRSNKTTNYRTNSFWVIITDGPAIREQLSSWIFHLKNVLLLNCQNMNATTNILTVPDMKEVLHDGTADEVQSVKLFPNSVCRYCQRHLVVATLESPVLQHHNIDGEYKGFIAEIFKLVSETLNFTYSYIEPSDGKYGEKLKNNTWNGLVGQLERYEVDIVVAELTIIAERLEVVDFIFPSFYQQAFGIVYKRGTHRGRDSSWGRIFRPLHVCVYVLLLLAVVFVAILFLITESSNTSDAERSTSSQVILIRSKQFLDFCLILFGFISTRGDGVQSGKASTRFLISSFWLLCIVITGVYIGNLTASLSDTKVKAPFNSLRGLSRLKDWKWGIRGATLSQNILHNSSSSLLYYMWGRILEFNKTDPEVLHHDRSVHMNKLYAEDKYAFLVADPQVIISNETECIFETMDGVISDLSLAIAVTKDSYLRADLDRVMARLIDSGILGYIRQKHLGDIYGRERSTCNTKLPLRAMQLEDTLGSFLVLMVGLVLGTVVLIIEKIVHNLC